MRKIIVNNELNDDWIRNNNPKQIDEIAILRLMIDECSTVNHSKSNLKHPGHASQKPHGNRGSNVGGGISQESIQKIINKPKSDYIDHMKDYIEDPDLLTKTINQEYDDWRDSLADNEIEAINYYTRKGYGIINQSIRENLYMDDTLKKQIASLDNAIDSCVVHEDCIVRRGITVTDISETYNIMSKLKTGDIISDKSYMSTSIGASSGGSIRLIMRVPKGTNAMFVGDRSLTKFPDENEYVFPRDTSLYVNSVRIVNEDKSGGVRNVAYIDVTVLPQINIPINTEKSYNLKHGNHDQSTHNPHKHSVSYRDKCNDIISKSKSDYKNYRGEFNGLRDIIIRNQIIDANPDFESWNNKLSPPEIDSILTYTATSYKTTNLYLRDKNGFNELLNKSIRSESARESYVSNLDNSIDNLDSSINRSQLQEDTILSRGITGNTSLYSQMSSLKEGDVWSDTAYISTGIGSNLDGDIIFEIHAPKGTIGAYLGFNNININYAENEFILPRNTKLYIHSITKTSNRLLIEASVLPFEGNQIATKSYNLKHPGHGDELVHNPHKGFSAKAQIIINKPNSDFKNLNNKLDAMGIYHYMNDKSSVKMQASVLTSNERLTIGKYYANMYSVINTSLRYNDTNTYSEEINNLDNAISKGTIDEDIIVERGLVTSKNGGASSSVYKQFKSMSVGDVWVDPAYISTSVSEGFNGFIQMKIRIPKGTNGIFVGTSSLSSNPLENEYILPRGSKFYINNISLGENKKLSITATVLPQED